MTDTQDLVERALAFVKRKYVARLHRDILYVEAGQDDLARETANFCAQELSGLQARVAELEKENAGLRKFQSEADRQRVLMQQAKELVNETVHPVTRVVMHGKGHLGGISEYATAALAGLIGRVAELEEALAKAEEGVSVIHGWIDPNDIVTAAVANQIIRYCEVISDNARAALARKGTP